jgi:hypothetical protein
MGLGDRDLGMGSEYLALIDAYPPCCDASENDCTESLAMIRLMKSCYLLFLSLNWSTLTRPLQLYVRSVEPIHSGFPYGEVSYRRRLWRSR